MQKIVTYESASGNTIENQYIYSENPNIKSLASLILLNDFYRQNDIDYLNKLKSDLEYLKERHKFLNNRIKEVGYLECHYCHKRHLEIGYEEIEKARINRANPNLATIDHKIPRVKCYNPMDTSNWLVACVCCNKSKRESDYEVFMKDKRMLKRRKTNDSINNKLKK